MRLYLEFDKVVRGLTRAKVRFAVAGGLAVGLHGFVRATRDIDLLVDPAQLDQVRKVLARLRYRENPGTIGFRQPGLELVRFYRRAQAGEELILVDVLLARSRAMGAVLRRARPMPYAELKLRVVAVADLVRMKRQRGSKQDEADIERLQQRRRPRTG